MYMQEMKGGGKNGCVAVCPFSGLNLMFTRLTYPVILKPFQPISLLLSLLFNVFFFQIKS